MKKILSVFLTILITISCYACVFATDTFMEFSVSDDWFVFSKNMEDTEFLDKVVMTKEEVNETLENSDCEYFLTNPQKKQQVYVKVCKTEYTYELYNISEFDDKYLCDNLDKILKEVFSVNNFTYDEALFNHGDQMKMITVPGTVVTNGEEKGLVLGVTFINGSGIGFIMKTDGTVPTDDDRKAFEELVSSVSFTSIKEKDDTVQFNDIREEKSQDALSYITGGLGAILLVGLCYYLIERMRKTEKSDDDESSNSLNGKAD